MYAVNLAQKAKELKREKRKSDSLLFQMLPPSVAMQLKQTQQVNIWRNMGNYPSDSRNPELNPSVLYLYKKELSCLL